MIVALNAQGLAAGVLSAASSAPAKRRQHETARTRLRTRFMTFPSFLELWTSMDDGPRGGAAAFRPLDAGERRSAEEPEATPEARHFQQNFGFLRGRYALAHVRRHRANSSESLVEEGRLREQAHDDTVFGAQIVEVAGVEEDVGPLERLQSEVSSRGRGGNHDAPASLSSQESKPRCIGFERP